MRTVFAVAKETKSKLDAEPTRLQHISSPDTYVLDMNHDESVRVFAGMGMTLVRMDSITGDRKDNRDYIAFASPPKPRTIKTILKEAKAYLESKKDSEIPYYLVHTPEDRDILESDYSSSKDFFAAKSYLLVRLESITGDPEDHGEFAVLKQEDSPW